MEHLARTNNFLLELVGTDDQLNLASVNAANRCLTLCLFLSHFDTWCGLSITEWHGFIELPRCLIRVHIVNMAIVYIVIIYG